MDSPGHSSPLWTALNQLWKTLSDDPFWLSQLDVDFARNYARLLHACRGFMTGWFHGTDKPWGVDKNRGWLIAIETLRLLDPEFRMAVCLRDPLRGYLLAGQGLFGQPLPSGVALTSAAQRAEARFWFRLDHPRLGRLVELGWQLRRYARRLPNLPRRLLTPAWYPAKHHYLRCQWCPERPTLDEEDHD